MSRRGFIIVLVCLAWSWAGCVNSVEAQSAAKTAKTDKLVRVTYPVADLIVPLAGFPAPHEKETLAETLIQVITNTVAPKSWKQAGGAGDIQFFPLGMALVANQRQDVHVEIARLLAELRRAQDVQVSIEMRAAHVSASMAKHLLLDMDEHGRPVRAIKEAGKESAQRFASMDDKQIATLLKLAQSNESTAIIQAPKLTMFNGQQGRLSCTRSGADTDKSDIVDGFQYDVLSVLDPEKKFVRMTLSLQHYTPKANARSHVTKAARTFVMAPGRTLVWHLGETTERRHLFVVATPRLVVVAEEERIFMGEHKPIPARGGAEEQSIPELKKPHKLISPKESAIEHRLRQPISLNFKQVPLSQAIKDLTIASGIQVVPDIRSLEEARINLDAPVTIRVENISMKSGLKLLLNPLRLRWIIEDDVLKITTQERGHKLITKTYNVGDLVMSMALVDGEAKKVETYGELLKELIQNNVARNDWESGGGKASIQYSPLENKLVINHDAIDVHEEIELLLATVRRLYDVSVDTELRFVRMSAGTALQWQKAMAQQGKYVDIVRSMPDVYNLVKVLPSKQVCASMDDLQVFMLLEAAQGDRTAVITQAPKLTLLNGQRGGVGPKELTANSWRGQVQTVVSPDRKSVRLILNVENRIDDEPRSVERRTKAAEKFNLPDGRTLVWDLGETAGRQHLFVLVTPRIRVRQEEERIFVGKEAPIPGR